MAAGYVLRRRRLRQSDGAEDAFRRWSHRLKLICIGVLMPPVAITAMIRNPLTGGNVVVMGALGIVCLLSGAILGRAYIAARPMKPREAGAFLGCAAMSNLVSFGGLITFAFWGNAGLQQLQLFKLFEHVLYFGVFFPWCSTFSPDLKPQQTGVIQSFLSHPVTIVPIAAVVIGLAANFAVYHGFELVTPPDWTQRINRVLVPVHAGLLTFSVGLTMSPSRVGRYGPKCAAIASISFIARPAIAAAAAFGCLKAGLINDLAFRVTVLLSAMPVAFNALIPPSLYHLDEDLANSCWIVTTALMVVVVPVLYFVLVSCTAT